MAFEINLGSYLDKQADNDISDIDHVGTKPNPGFPICSCLGFSTHLRYACNSGRFWDRFPMLHIAKRQIVFIFHSQFHHKSKLLPKTPVRNSRIYSLQTFFLVRFYFL